MARVALLRADLAAALAENKRLRGLVRAAYDEAWDDRVAWEMGQAAVGWNTSDAKAALGAGEVET